MASEPEKRLLVAGFEVHAAHRVRVVVCACVRAHTVWLCVRVCEHARAHTHEVV